MYVSGAQVTHRKLCSDSGRILREVQAGATFVVTVNGRPAGSCAVAAELDQACAELAAATDAMKGDCGESYAEALQASLLGQRQN